jgi:hypothetical protein
MHSETGEPQVEKLALPLGHYEGPRLPGGRLLRILTSQLAGPSGHLFHVRAITRGRPVRPQAIP